MRPANVFHLPSLSFLLFVPLLGSHSTILWVGRKAGSLGGLLHQENKNLPTVTSVTDPTLSASWGWFPKRLCRETGVEGLNIFTLCY